MDADAWAALVGKITVDFYRLELALRHFLHRRDTSGLAADVVLPSLSVGEVIPSDALSNADRLGQLIEKFNRAVTANGKNEFSLDPRLMYLRDVLDQGRIWASDARPPYRMVMFSQPANGLVTCTFDELMDDRWLDAQEHRASDALDQVAKAAHEP